MKTYAIEFKNGNKEYVSASSRKSAFMKKFGVSEAAAKELHGVISTALYLPFFANNNTTGARSMTYKHGNWFCKPADEAEAKEIIERAVASGAEDKYRWDPDIEKFGVVGGIVEWCDNCTDTEYTIEQVREKFPLPGELVEQEWSGEGLPPVGVEFEFSQNGISWAERVMLFNDGITCLMASKKHPGNRGHYKSDDPSLLFRPIRSERELWVEDCCKNSQIADCLNFTKVAGAIYDAIRAGDLKAPGAE